MLLKYWWIYESNTVSAPKLPILTFSSINSPTGKTGDILIGEPMMLEILV